MSERLAKLQNDDRVIAGLESIGLSPRDLAEARLQMMHAEAIVDVLYGAWSGLSALLPRAWAAIARRSVRLADAYAESAMRAAARRRNEYLAQATDTADLERRFRSLQVSSQVPMPFARP